MNYALLDQAVRFIQQAWPEAHPSAALICGSGWSNVVEAFELHGSLSYEDIPGLGKPGVAGHAGKLSWGTLHGVETFIFQGRRHYYEGVGWTPIALPVYAAKKCGVQTVVLTNSAGCIREDLSPGDLLGVRDHFNFMGANPLIGDHKPCWGPRFPDQTYVYTEALREKLIAAGKDTGIEVSQGAYLAAAGPSYESPFEIQAFKKWGADAVGMSTVPEAILASAAGMNVACVSCMTNYAAGIGGQALSHEEVTHTTQATMPRMKGLLENFWKRLG